MKKLLLIFILVSAIILVKDVFSSSTYSLSKLEIDRNVTRQEYLGDGLGKVYKNRFGVIFFNNVYPKINKLQTKFFTDISSGVIFIPLYILLVIVGIKKFNE